MRIVTVELVYAERVGREVKVKVGSRAQGNALMEAINKQVEKQEEADKDWERWNLLDIREEGE